MNNNRYIYQVHVCINQTHSGSQAQWLCLCLFCDFVLTLASLIEVSLVLLNCLNTFDLFRACGLYCSIALTKQNFTLKYDTNIPRQVVRIQSNEVKKYIYIFP